ncbi:MAG: aconitase X [Bacillota bacterium]
MRLTDYEKRMLDGVEGKLKQKAMEIIVQYGKVLGAEELCEVTKAHLFCGSHHYLNVVSSEDMEVVLSEMLFCSKEKISLTKMACYCQSDVGPMDPVCWSKMGITKLEYEKNMQYLQYFLASGVNLVGSCVPYLLGFIPLMGEHYVTSESHAVLMINSLWGACGNADGIEAGFCSAVCGRTPLWGNHIMSNRKGTHIFDVRCKTETVTDWDLLGYTVGKMTPSHAIPVITGNFRRPDITKLKSSFAAMATTSGAEMCHIVGITPEAITLEQALGWKDPLDVIQLTDYDLEDSLNSLNVNENEPVDYISLGCPHYSIEEIRYVAEFLESKRVSRNVILHIWTAAPIKETANRCGYITKIEEAGGIVLTSSCPLTSEKIPEGVRAIAFDSTKQAHYIIPQTLANVHYGSMEDCLKSAVSGRWEGKSRCQR